MSSPSPPKPKRSLRRRALVVVFRVALLYCGIVAVFLLLERFLVFRPDTAAVQWFNPADPRTVDVTFRSSDGPLIHAWWLPPERPDDGAFLVAGGNGGNLCYRGTLAADLRRVTGAGVLLFDYPGYGKSEGKPSEAGCYAAGEAAHHWLTTDAKVPENRVVLLGESLGGGSAVELATRHDHRALVLLYTFTTLPAAAKHHYPYLPTHWLMRTRFDNLSKIGRCRRPVFIAHGTADTIVPFPQGEALFAAANEPKEFFRMEGVGHGISGDDFYDALTRFLQKHAP
jgi:fermentation-respiration switch protein FrsA (DUF1100 family)